MSSWFQGLTKTVQSSVSGATSVLESSVNKASNVLEKLTLTTPELSAARRELEHSAAHKVALKNQLARLLPWETDDPDCRILVAECQTAILELSKHKSTFFGPYELVPQPKTTAELDGQKKPKPDELPSEESKTILATLSPLPKLLGDNFDMNMHVGLIERLLQIDPHLVQMQAAHSGGGRREIQFWQNYFIHIAHCRYAAGLGMDEIWGDHVVENVANHKDMCITTTTTAKATSAAVKQNEEEEEEVVDFTQHHDDTTPISGRTADTSNNSGFEMVSEVSEVDDHDEFKKSGAASNGGDDEGIVMPDDYELDELEAEIARELEDE